jgi:hypothetical protein
LSRYAAGAPPVYTYTQCSQAPKRTKPLSHFTNNHPPRASRYLG